MTRLNKEIKQLESSIGKKNQAIEKKKSSIRNTVDRLERLMGKQDTDDAFTWKDSIKIAGINAFGESIDDAETVSSFVPLIGQLLSSCQAVTGRMCFSNEELSDFDRAISGAGIVFGGYAKVIKITKGGIEGLEIVAKNTDKGRELVAELSRLAGAGKGISEIGGYKLSSHADARMIERGISFGQVENAIKHGNEFSYFHEGVWKTGYYDNKEGIFVGVKDIITTVINNVDSNYIENLKKFKP